MTIQTSVTELTMAALARVHIWPSVLNDVVGGRHSLIGGLSKIDLSNRYLFSIR
jgi:hypothetical protein